MTPVKKQQAPGSNLSGPRLLVVDDAEGIRTYLAHLLELKGYDVDTAEDGRRALALLEGGAAPDVVILDVMMTGLDGIETLRRIRPSFWRPCRPSSSRRDPARGPARCWPGRGPRHGLPPRGSAWRDPW